MTVEVDEDEEGREVVKKKIWKPRKYVEAEEEAKHYVQYLMDCGRYLTDTWG